MRHRSARERLRALPFDDDLHRGTNEMIHLHAISLVPHARDDAAVVSLVPHRGIKEMMQPCLIHPTSRLFGSACKEMMQPCLIHRLAISLGAAAMSHAAPKR